MKIDLKVIAIEDSQPYKKGDIFEVYSFNPDWLVIWHPTFGKMHVTSNNFELLSDFRNRKIDEALR